MRVKRFIGETVVETMGKVKKDLGPDAVILQTRQFREGGFLGFFGKVKVEIVAAIEERSPVRSAAKPSLEVYALAAQGLNSQGPGGQGLVAGSRAPVQPRQAEGWDKTSYRTGGTPENENTEEGFTPTGLGSLETAGTDAKAETTTLHTELRQMRTLLADVNKQMGNLGRVSSLWPQPLQAWAEGLRERGISEPLVKRLLHQVQQTIPEEEWAVHALVWANIQASVRGICSPTAAIQPGRQRPRVVALVGQTGVGKTTTIGKLAAGFSLVDKRRVALITADTYRVAAVEQLKTFGEIIGVPVEVVMTPTGLRDALIQHADKELIFIDTAGRSPQHDLHMSELRAFLDRAKPDLTMLVLSATTQTADQLQVFRRFGHLANHLIVTKLDETIRPGSLLDILDQTSLPTAYVTTGQNVPDDIEAAEPERLAHYILGEEETYA